jgi:iron(III) transport system ATP-binding protein
MAMADRIAVMSDGRVEQIGTATEIYSRPASRFVADFIGESNFIDVDWGDGAVVTSRDEIPLASPDTAGSGSGSLMVRPESVHLIPASPQERGLLGQVVTVSFLGSFTRVTVDCPAVEDPLVVDITTKLHEQVRAGALVQLRWEADAAVLFTDAGNE